MNDFYCLSYELKLESVHKVLLSGNGGVCLTALFVVTVFAVIVVNGFTDAPNAIATCVSSRAMSPRGAVVLAGICNFLGAVTASVFSSEVAETVYSIVDFGEDSVLALSSVFAAMCAVVIWAVVAFLFGIPTSESHALMSGVVGAAIGGRMSLDAVDFKYIAIVLAGLVISTLPAYFLSKWIYTLVVRIFSFHDRRRSMRCFLRAQRASAAVSAFLHGAQDSQKFAGVLMLGIGMSAYSGSVSSSAFQIPISISMACATAMTVGTFFGGSRIIKKVGDDMVRLDASAGTAADAASSAVLALCTVSGIPVSTTHSKTSAMMGAGSKTSTGVNRVVARQMIAAWLLTFPCCAALGFLFGSIIK